MKEIQFHQVKIDFYCDRCEAREKGVDVQECIFNGPPMCQKCDEEMSPDKIFLDK
jgi:NAD-dependent SIR2 family protein deacetylase